MSSNWNHEMFTVKIVSTFSVCLFSSQKLSLSSFSHLVPHFLMGSFRSPNCNLKQMTFTADDSDSELNKSQNGVRKTLSLSHTHTHSPSLSLSLFLKWLTTSLSSPLSHVNHIGIKSPNIVCLFYHKKLTQHQMYILCQSDGF